ncbi:beta-1,6-N-acetylglucosaminyltransferase [Dendronalium sp. ChiSLP03b]|uniref:beta-1,6-N-acetylglucosaminyltransferase n=1 Tax=Dendronalium sp. ChiSLP03b TaxID=3075381 RepID=UPI002AD55639|nr:beta-1,6-N-acetylglucosaminyltransferase [Dendronalium sp. ChiSLP03b]MDZ8206525.1 beta-1,6-N-acetylglucosaminyltransferase [Dendronalium sp. ChiSLP03b]
MEIAYIISAYKYPQQLIRLVNRLNVDKTSFLIHVDKKTNNEIYQEMVQGLSKYSNVYFLERHKCYWGDFGHVLASIKGIKKIFDSQISCDYIKLLTGQCYPIKSSQQIRDFLKQINYYSLVNFFPLPSDVWIKGGEHRGGIDRIEYFYFNLFNKRFQASLFQYQLKRKFPKDFKPFGGSSYWCFSRELAEYVNNFVSQNLCFTNFFKNVAVPDEIFFQTIIMNSPFKEKIINNCMTYTQWLDSSDSPEILGINDFNKLSQSSCLYARKFDASQDSQILDLIDKYLL